MWTATGCLGVRVLFSTTVSPMCIVWLWCRTVCFFGGCGRGHFCCFLCCLLWHADAPAAEEGATEQPAVEDEETGSASMALLPQRRLPPPPTAVICEQVKAVFHHTHLGLLLRPHQVKIGTSVAMSTRFNTPTCVVALTPVNSLSPVTRNSCQSKVSQCQDSRQLLRGVWVYIHARWIRKCSGAVCQVPGR